MGPCVEFEGYILKSGYGQCWADGRAYQAHRLAYSRAKGPIPKGLLILHRCNNRRCINVEHLYAGTQKQNMQDAIAAGTTLKGERNHRGKLTADDVLSIRVDARPHQEIAEEYQVSRAAISQIIRRETWGWLHG